MVHDHVHDDLEAFAARCLCQCAVFLIGAEAGVNLVIVCGGITVVGPLGLVVFEQGIEPYGGESHVVEVVEMLCDAGEVTTVTSMVIGAIGRLQ